MRTITFGRSNDNFVVVNDRLVSRYHCRIVMQDDGSIVLTDNGSTNGTFVNGTRVNGSVFLHPNDSVRIGLTDICWQNYFDLSPRGNMNAAYNGASQPPRNDFHGYSFGGAPIININNNVSQNQQGQQGQQHYNHQNQRDTYERPYRGRRPYLNGDRSFGVTFLLCFITLGIYALYIIHAFAKETNIACAEDGRHTNGLLLYLLFSLLTLGIYPIFWTCNWISRCNSYLIDKDRPEGLQQYTYILSLLFGWLTFGILNIVVFAKMIYLQNDVNSTYNVEGC